MEQRKKKTAAKETAGEERHQQLIKLQQSSSHTYLRPHRSLVLQNLEV
jgi:hypothetical protein